MSMISACCQMLEGRSPSPFEISMLGWHDGLTSGMARCRTCGATYHIEMLVWDDDHEMRIYGFKEVSRQSYDAFIALQTLPAPLPHQSQERSDALTLRVRDALATGLHRILYIAAVDLTAEIRAVRKVTFQVWASLLGLNEYFDPRGK